MNQEAPRGRIDCRAVNKAFGEEWARTIVVHGAVSGGVHRTEPDGQGQWTRNGSYRLSWTLTLRRRG